jgi:4-carboxymuconolactone decarboxylase
MMQRFPDIALDDMTPAQRQVADAILAGPRGSLMGPFKTWLHSPEMADRLQRVGEFLRFNSSLPRDLNEFAICITAVTWNASFEWYAHYQMAVDAGVPPALLADLLAGRRPAGMSDDATMIYEFCTQLHRQRQVSDAAFAAVARRFGAQGAAELVALCGYYTLVAMTLNVAQVPAPDSDRPALPPPAVPD